MLDNSNVSYQTLKDLSYWTGFVGIWSIIIGVVGIISIGGIISGILALIMGMKLRRTKMDLESYINSNNEQALQSALDNLKSYFKIAGVMIIITLIMVIIIFGIMLGGGFSSFQNLM